MPVEQYEIEILQEEIYHLQEQIYAMVKRIEVLETPEPSDG